MIIPWNHLFHLRKVSDNIQWIQPEFIQGTLFLDVFFLTHSFQYSAALNELNCQSSQISMCIQKHLCVWQQVSLANLWLVPDGRQPEDQLKFSISQGSWKPSGHNPTYPSEKGSGTENLIFQFTLDQSLTHGLIHSLDQNALQNTGY